MIEINQFVKFIESKLELPNKSIKVVSYSTKPLVAVGENYGSIILAVEVSLSNGNKQQLVAKLNPELEMVKKIFNISIAFKKEAEFYKSIVPLLHNFQKAHNVEILDSFPKSYGYRCSLSSDPDVFDDDACLVLENLKFQGYASGNRHNLFDLSTAKYIIRMLAQFHAVPIAIKLKKPEVFAEIKSHLRLNLTDSDFTTSNATRVTTMVEKFILQDEELAQYATKVKESIYHCVKQYINMDVLGNEPFNTLTHNDVWLPNIMLKLNDTGKPIGNRLVDYQMAAYGNPANDILFFLHSSIKCEVITEHYDQLVDVYFEEFIRTLEEYKVDTGMFSKEAFLKEIDHAAKNLQLYHVMFMMICVFVVVKDDNVTDKMLTTDFLSVIDIPRFSKHLKAVVMNWVKHNWL